MCDFSLDDSELLFVHAEEPARLRTLELSSGIERDLLVADAINLADWGLLAFSSAVGACCHADHTCTDGMEESECLAAGGRYLGDGIACVDDPDGDDVWGCDDFCPTSPAPAGVDSEGRPFGDLDRDCDVDLEDYAIMAENFSGPGS